MKNIRSPLKIAHSRINALRKADLAAHGYQLLTESQHAGVDIFAKRLRSHFVFFQGHPEYEAQSLQREYLRDITRYLARQREIFPAAPEGYFDAETERKLANYRKRATAERQIPLSVELPHLVLRSDLATGVAASAIFGNWLQYLSDGVRLSAGIN
jgi:homoserine O-succinyltransferase/O-acetyltransferase